MERVFFYTCFVFILVFSIPRFFVSSFCQGFSDVASSGENSTAASAITSTGATTVTVTTVNDTDNFTTINSTVVTDNSTVVSTVATNTLSNATGGENVTTINVTATTTTNDVNPTTETDDNSTTIVETTTVTETVTTTLIVNTENETTVQPPTTVLTTNAATTLAASTEAATTQSETTVVTTAAPTTEEATTQGETTLTPTTEEPTTTVTTEVTSADTAPTNTPTLKCDEVAVEITLSVVHSDIECTSHNNNTVSDAEDDATITVTFPETLPGNYAMTEELCKACENVNKSIGFRLCNESAVWETPVYLDCSVGIESITDPVEQSNALLVLTETNEVEVNTAISIINDLSDASSIEEEVVVTLLVVVDKVVQASDFSDSVSASSKEDLRDSLEQLASTFDDSTARSYSEFMLAVLKKTTSRKKRATDDCSTLTLGTNTTIISGMSMTSVELVEADEEFLYYGSTTPCGGSNLVVLGYSDDTWFPSDAEVKSPILYVSSSNLSASDQTTTAKLQLFSVIKDAETTENDTYTTTTTYNASCALWEGQWLEGKCTETTTTVEYVVCTCSEAGNIVVIQVVNVDYAEKKPVETGLPTGAIIGIIVGSVIGVILLLALIAYICKAKNKEGRKVKPDNNGGYEMVDSRNVSPNGRGPSR